MGFVDEINALHKIAVIHSEAMSELNARVKALEDLLHAGYGQPITSAQVANFLGVHPQTVRRWRIKGTGPKYTESKAPPHSIRYTLRDVIEWASGEEGAASLRTSGLSKRRRSFYEAVIARHKEEP